MNNLNNIKHLYKLKKYLVGGSPTEFTLVDYPTMDELEIY